MTDCAKNLDDAVAAGAEYLQRMFWRASLTDGDYKTAANAFLEAIGYEGLLAERDELLARMGLTEVGGLMADLEKMRHSKARVEQLEANLDATIATAVSHAGDAVQAGKRIEALEALLREASSWMGGMSTKSQTAEEELRDWLDRYRALMGEESSDGH